MIALGLLLFLTVSINIIGSRHYLLLNSVLDFDLIDFCVCVPVVFLVNRGSVSSTAYIARWRCEDMTCGLSLAVCVGTNLDGYSGNVFACR